MYMGWWFKLQGPRAQGARLVPRAQGPFPLTSQLVKRSLPDFLVLGFFRGIIRGYIMQGRPINGEKCFISCGIFSLCKLRIFH